MSKPERRDPEKEKFWRRTLLEYRSSGLGQTEFCRQRGVNVNSLNAWARILRARDGEEMKSKSRTSVKSGRRSLVSTANLAELGDRSNEIMPESFVPVEVVDSSREVTKPKSDVAVQSHFLEVLLRRGIVIRVSSQCPQKFLGEVVSMLDEP